MTRLLLLLAVGLAGCPSPSAPSDPTPEPPETLDLPSDPGAPGVPVGITTATFEGQTFEVWYPATDGVADAAGQSLSLDAFVPDAFIDRVGAFELTALTSDAVREAPPRRLASSVPVLLFSHGFGGFRTQSASLCEHLASRGYVVVAADHPGRMLGDVLPCLFDPPLDGCDLAGLAGGDDPAVDDLLAARRWVELTAGGDDHPVGALMDAGTLGIFGHSAGGGTAMELGGLDAKLSAILSMAAPASTDADKPAAILGGRCDPFADPPSLTGALAGLSDGVWVDIEDAGHMPFADMCAAELDVLADDLLVGRPDVDAGFLESMLDLAASGCPGITPPADPPCGPAFLPLADSGQIIETYATAFFDQALSGTGEGIVGGLFDHAEVTR